MPNLKLRPWKFPAGKKVMLYRIHSPYREQNGKWTLQAVFQVSGSRNLEIIDFPWGTLPALQVGWYYVDGLPVEPMPEITSENLFISELDKGNIIRDSNVSANYFNLTEDMIETLNLGNQHLWQYIDQDKILFVPCLELLRSFLLPSKTLANLILRPNGIESLVNDETINDDVLEIYISKEFPSRLVTNQNVAHLVWLLYNPVVKKSWDSVYGNIFSNAIEKSPSSPVAAMAAGSSIEFVPPDIGSCLMKVSAIGKNAEYFVNRIYEFSLEDFPFKTIIYSHPSIKEKKVVKSKTKRYRSKSRTTGNDLFLDEERRDPGYSFDQVVADTEIVHFGFNFASNLIKLPQGQALIFTGNSEDNKDKTPQEWKGVSADELVYGGQIQPIEFSSLQVSLEINEREFNDFFETIKIIKTRNPKIKTEFTIIDILGDKNFCFVMEKRRKCATMDIFIIF